MPFPYNEQEEFTIDPAAFNEHGITVLTVTGARYGGDWDIRMGATTGRITTCYPHKDRVTDDEMQIRALETAFVWLRDATVKQHLRLLHFASLQDKIQADQRQYFIAAQVAVGNAAFVAQEGATYADQITLDAALRTPAL